jgi:hypothetical protein
MSDLSPGCTHSSCRIGSHLKHHRFDFLAFFFLAVFLAVCFFTADFDFLAAFVFGITLLATLLTFFTTFLAASFVAWAALSSAARISQKTIGLRQLHAAGGL